MKTFNFDEFVYYGVHHGGNIVRGMPWSFKFYGHAVTHEDDNHYIICRVTADCRPNDIHFTRTDILAVENDGSLTHYRKG
jgi:hypothetical protein